MTTKKESYDTLREILKPGDTVHCILRHVSRSGMMRHIDFYKLEDGSMRYLSGYIADLLDYKRTDQGSLKVSGCGMDMGFSVVYNLSSALYRESGYQCLKELGYDRCPSNFHVNNRDKTLTEPIHHDGYAINHRWI